MKPHFFDFVFNHASPRKPSKPPRPAVSARFYRHLNELTKDHVEPSADLRADYARYLEIKRRQNASA